MSHIAVLGKVTCGILRHHNLQTSTHKQHSCMNTGQMISGVALNCPVLLCSRESSILKCVAVVVAVQAHVLAAALVPRWLEWLAESKQRR